MIMLKRLVNEQHWSTPPTTHKEMAMKDECNSQEESAIMSQATCMRNRPSRPHHETIHPHNDMKFVPSHRERSFIQPTQDPFLKDLRLKWHLHFESQTFKSNSCCCDTALYPISPRKPVSIKDSPQRGLPGLPLLREVAKGRLLYGFWLSGDMWEIEQCQKDVPKKTCFWNVGASSKASLSKEGPSQFRYLNIGCFRCPLGWSS
jgi:hypothetical protein